MISWPWLVLAWLEWLLPWCAAAACCAALFYPPQRQRWSRLGAALLLIACVSLGVHLIADHFAYRYVWLYSGAALPWYLKLANLWGGEEGTLLFIATLMGLLALRLNHYAGWAGGGALVLTAIFAAGAALWSPFELTPEADLQRLSSQGMNVHLVRFWMALHPPLIFTAYVFLLAPVGAALEALCTGRGDWLLLAHRYSRSGWFILSTGLAAGMAWAYEDFTFGQFWHWDPVQTSVFAVWAFATATLHGLKAYRSPVSRLLPALSVLTGAIIFLSMAITRDAVLASSHRYIGAHSFWFFASLALALLIITILAWGYSYRHGSLASRSHSERPWLLRFALVLFSLAAIIAVIQLIQAYWSAYHDYPRPASLKPFFRNPDTLDPSSGTCRAAPSIRPVGCG